MAARSTWKGSLRLSLISIPIRVFPATNPGSDVSFRQFHRKCHTPIKMKRWCPHCEEEVALDDIVKGYESAKGQFVMVDPEDVAKLRPESNRTVEITHVLEGGVIDPLYIERAYFLAPDNKAAGSSFAVLREALAGKAAIGRLALHGREYLAAVVARAPELLLYTLRTAGEVRDAGSIEELRFAATKVKADEVKLARQVLNSFEAVTDLSTFSDHYEDALKEMLSRKDAEVVSEPGAAKATAPANLMEALRKSLAQVSAAKKTPILPYRQRPARHTRRAS